MRKVNLLKFDYKCSAQAHQLIRMRVRTVLSHTFCIEPLVAVGGMDAVFYAAADAAALPRRCIYWAGHVRMAHKRVYACRTNCKHTQTHLLSQTQRTHNNIKQNKQLRVHWHKSLANRDACCTPTHNNNIIWMAVNGVKLFMQNTIGSKRWLARTCNRSFVIIRTTYTSKIIIVERECAQNWRHSIVDKRLSIKFECDRICEFCDTSIYVAHAGFRSCVHHLRPFIYRKIYSDRHFKKSL